MTSLIERISGITQLKAEDLYLNIDAVQSTIVCSRNGEGVATIQPDKFSVRKKSSGNGIDVLDGYKTVTGGQWNQVLIQGTPVTESNFTTLASEVKAAASGGSPGGDINVIDNLTSTSATDALSANQGRVLNEKIALSLSYNEDGNIEVKQGAKILGTESSGAEDVMLWLATYTLPDGTKYQQLEVGSTHIHLNLNTNDDTEDYGHHVTVDTPSGKKTIPYVDDLKKQNAFYQADISQTGSVLSFSFGTVTANITRSNSTEISVELSSSSDISIDVTARHTGSSSILSSRQNYALTSSMTEIDTITVGTYILVEYWVKKENELYYITAGSNDDQSNAWVEITTYNNQ